MISNSKTELVESSSNPVPSSQSSCIPLHLLLMNPPDLSNSKAKIQKREMNVEIDTETRERERDGDEHVHERYC